MFAGTTTTNNKRYEVAKEGVAGKRLHFLPTYLSTITLRFGTSTLNRIFIMVSSIPFENRNFDIAYSPPMTLKLRKGNALDHAMTLASMFYGFGERTAYVCLGMMFSENGPTAHAWVLTFAEDGVVKFWDPLLMRTFELADRFLDFEKSNNTH